MQSNTKKEGRELDFEESNLADPVFLAELRQQMLKFAQLQLSDQHLAEDAVQDALVGALKNSTSFNRQAALKTWVFAILKNKIADILRKRIRLNETTHSLDDGEYAEDHKFLFDSKGFWQKEEKPGAWAQPMEALKNDHFWLVFDSCLNDLPANQARVFMMREFIELDSTEICKALDMTTSNLHVLLYRSRLRLRNCLEKLWFIEGD
jgi:RNA polymerase sigma-70 factor (TIGR02943 family)